MSIQQKIKEFRRSNLSTRMLLGLFLAALIISYIVHLHFRKKHFQECDSTLAYYLFQDQPQKGLIYANWNFPYAKKPLSVNILQKLFENSWREQKITNEMLNDEVDCRFKNEEIDIDKLQSILKTKKLDDRLFGFVASREWNPDTVVERMNRFLINKDLPSQIANYIDSTIIPSKIKTAYQKALTSERMDSIQLCKVNRILLEQLFPKAIQKIAIREIIQNKISIQQLYRILEVYATDEFIGSKPIQQSIQFALGSTYSPAVGLCYYAILQSSHSFNDFLFSSLALTITLFHVSAFLFVWLLIRFRFSALAAVLTGILFLFSISLYSYSFHLGSTIWNIFTAIVWLFIYAWAIEKDTKKQRSIMSIVSGMLLFFNYLIFFYWLSFMLLQAFILWKQNGKINFKFTYKLAVSQWFFWGMLTIVMLVFYQAAQGNKGNMQTFTEFYSVLLNFFALFNQYTWLTVVQFLFITLCIVHMVIYLFQLIRKKVDIHTSNNQLAYYFLFFTLVLTFTFVVKLLGNAASRHILWITPIFFLFFAFFFDQLKNQKQIMLLIPFGLIVLGFVGVFERQKQTRNNKDYAWEKRTDIDHYLVHDFIFDVYYNLVEKNKTSSWSDYYAKLQKGKRYMFISQTHTFQHYTDSIASILREKDIQVEVISSKETPDQHHFVAYAPVMYFHDRSNAIYVTEFLTK